VGNLGEQLLDRWPLRYKTPAIELGQAPGCEHEINRDQCTVRAQRFVKYLPHPDDGSDHGFNRFAIHQLLASLLF